MQATAFLGVDISCCELCNQYEMTRNMHLFIIREKMLVATDNRQWEQKAGVRHICHNCVNEVRQNRL